MTMNPDISSLYTVVMDGRTERNKLVLAAVVLYEQLLSIEQESLRLQALININRLRRAQIRKRQLRINATLVAMIAAIGRGSKRRYRPGQKVVWCREKSSHFWTDVVPGLTDPMWKECFRMAKSTFEKLCGDLARFLQRTDTKMRRCIALEKRVAMCLYTLTSSAELKVVAELFGVGKSTLCEALHEFCNCLVENFMDVYVKFPTTAAAVDRVMTAFADRHGFPLCLGALGAYHIPILPPKSHADDYCDLEGRYSMVLLATCDHECHFTSVSVGTHGPQDEAQIYDYSELREKLASDSYCRFGNSLNGKFVKPFLLAGSAFHVDETLMRPFEPVAPLSEVECDFNVRHASAMRTIETTFERLKGRFRIVAKRCDLSLDNIPNVVRTCCVLHNLCEELCDEFDPNWKLEMDEARNEFGEERAEGERSIRDTLAAYFINENLQ